MPYTQETINAIEILREWADPFKWYLIPLFAFVIYMYAVEIENRNWNRVFAGLAFWGMDWANEIINGLILYFTDYQALWTCAGETGFLILVGLNIEISLMFAMAGIAFTKLLPTDKNWKIDLSQFKIPVKIPNRWAFAVINSIFCVFVEIILNQAGALLWVYDFWNVNIIGWIPIVIFGYLHFMIVSFWVYDMKEMKNKVITVGFIYLLDIIALILFIGVLGWI